MQWTRLILILLVSGLPLIVPADAYAGPNGQRIYKLQCSACHPGGKNISDPKKPVAGSKHLKDKDAFKKFLSKSQGSMPAFEKIAKNDASLAALYEYVKGLK